MVSAYTAVQVSDARMSLELQTLIAQCLAGAGDRGPSLAGPSFATQSVLSSVSDGFTGSPEVGGVGSAGAMLVHQDDGSGVMSMQKVGRKRGVQGTLRDQQAEGL